MAGITSSYRIGPSDFFTPGDLLADAATLNDQVNRLNDQNWDKPSEGLYDAFQAFLSEWRRFYSSMGFWSALNNGNRDELIQMETRFGVFVAKYQEESGMQIPDVVAPSTGTKDGLGDQLRNQLQPLIPSVNMTYVLIAIILGALVWFFGRGYIARKVLS